MIHICFFIHLTEQFCLFFKIDYVKVFLLINYNLLSHIYIPIIMFKLTIVSLIRYKKLFWLK